MSNLLNNDIPWVLVDCNEELANNIAREAGLPPVLGRLLVNRGITEPEAAKEFLNPDIRQLEDPYLLPDMEIAVERLAKAVESGEKICVHGDYDVDGVTGTALLVRALTALKAKVGYWLPNRHKDGYDIKPAMVEQAVARGVSLIVTCDCGIQAYDAVKKAAELGVDIIITDHHEPGDVLPPALAVINPKREDSNYPFSELAGVGVAFKLIQALVKRLGFSEDAFISKFVDLTAIGTVADVVPLLGENRVIVSNGLAAIPSSRKIGLQAILTQTGMLGKPISTYSIGYVIGPRINACGRMADASKALRLLLTRDEFEAAKIVQEIERHNDERRVQQEKVVCEAIEQIEKKDLESLRVLVISGNEWNCGVVGIAAGKICEMYNRPTILVGRDEKRGIATGSARSIPVFHMLDALHHCKELLADYGGHALAAGVSIPIENLERFEEKINAYAIDIIPEEEIIPSIEVEAELQAHEINDELANLVLSMEPFGMGNPEPLFMTSNMEVLEVRRVGDGSHLKLTLQGNHSPQLACIAFGLGDFADIIDVNDKIDLCYNIRFNEFNGSKSVQLYGKAIRSRRS